MAKKIRIPKRVIGIKIPKALRKNSLIKGLLGSHTGRQVIADALMAAAAAAAAALAAGGPKGVAKAGAAVAHAAEDGTTVAKRAVKSAVDALTDSLSGAAKAAFTDEPRNRRSSTAH